jgi:hypothetical protein
MPNRRQIRYDHGHKGVPKIATPQPNSMERRASRPSFYLRLEKEKIGRLPRGHSYRSASAGRMREADHDGYKVATSEIPMATSATNPPSIARGANGT